MESILGILTVFGLGLFGMLLYAVITVRSKIKEEGFVFKKFFKDNKWFWLSGISLHALVAIMTAIVPEITDLLYGIGFAIEDTSPGGWILFGVNIGGGADRTKLGGSKTLIGKK